MQESGVRGRGASLSSANGGAPHQTVASGSRRVLGHAPTLDEPEAQAGIARLPNRVSAKK